MEACPSILAPETKIRAVIAPALLILRQQEVFEEKVFILGGEVENDVAMIREVIEISGLFTQGEFKISFQEWLNAVRELESRGVDYIGILHTHPYSTFIPSPLDVLRMSECPGEIWIIVSPRGAKAWVYDSQLRELELILS